MEESSMADKQTSGSKKPARKQKVDLEELSRSCQELSEEQARAVKGGTEDVTINHQKAAEAEAARVDAYIRS
jgi:hypothetical protein